MSPIAYTSASVSISTTAGFLAQSRLCAPLGATDTNNHTASAVSGERDMASTGSFILVARGIQRRGCQGLRKRFLEILLLIGSGDQAGLLVRPPAPLYTSRD